MPRKCETDEAVSAVAVAVIVWANHNSHGEFRIIDYIMVISALIARRARARARSGERKRHHR